MRKYISAAAVFFAALLALTHAERAFAGTEHNIAGYAWSSGIGWISFNSTNDHDPDTAGVQPSSVNYGVNMNSDGTLTGYAWSSAVGWIQFGGLSGFPIGSGTQSINAKVNGNNLQGWIRALSTDGGWDGWISLSGAAPSYGVTLSGSSFAGYAWGADVVGWILFDVQNLYPGTCSNCGVSLAGDVSLDAQLAGASIANNSAVPWNSNPDLVWTITNLPSVSCSLSKTSSGGTPFNTLNGITASNHIAAGALTGPTSYTYSFACTNPSISKQVSFTVAAEPASFSLGGAETMDIKFLAAGAAESETKSFFVDAHGGFSDNVSVDVDTGASTCSSAITTYSLGGAAYASNPSPVTIVKGSNNYAAGSTLRVRVSQPISNDCVIRLVGTAPSYGATKDYLLKPKPFDPSFQEY